MDVSIQTLAQAAEAEQSGGQRPLGNSMSQNNPGQSGQGASPDGAQVLTFSQAFPNVAKPEPGGAIGVIDRLRNDFVSFQSKLLMPATTTANTANVSPAMQDSMQIMRETMDRAVSAQSGLFQLSVSLNAGLTATHQSQGAVKTLIEKS